MRVRIPSKRRTAARLAIIAAVLICAEAAAAKADFGGTWVLDPAASEGVSPGVEQTLVVTHAGDRVEAQNTIKGPQGEQVVKDAYVLDGKEVDFTPAIVGGGTGKGRRTSKWTPAGDGFDVSETATLDGPEGEVRVKATRRWALSPGGKTLTIEMTYSGPNGDIKTKRVFGKK